MLLFHEGLPGSGKSYAAVKDHMVPALRKGRKVFAYIEGLDHARIALVAGITEERCRELLVQITKDQVPNIYDHVQNDGLVFIDELQDFWSSSRSKLDPQITEFITQHRHRGLDVVLMGQVLQDCHAIWRNRVDQNVFFYNRDAIGKADEYKWSVRKKQSNGKFQEVTSGVEKYDPNYFGCYASHSADTENVVKYEDKRANVWASPVLRRTLPVYALLLVVGLGFIVWMFWGGGLVDASTKGSRASREGEHKTVASESKATVPEAASVKTSAQVVTTITQVDTVQPPGDIVDALTSEYRIRVGGSITANGRQAGWIEWRDVDGGVREVLSYVQLAGLGWLVMGSPDGGLVTVSKLARKYYATAWPLRDIRGRASEESIRSLKPTDSGGA